MRDTLKHHIVEARTRTGRKARARGAVGACATFLPEGVPPC